MAVPEPEAASPVAIQVRYAMIFLLSYSSAEWIKLTCIHLKAYTQRRRDRVTQCKWSHWHANSLYFYKRQGTPGVL